MLKFSPNIEAPCTEDDLARHFAAFSLFHSNTRSPPTSNFERLRPPLQYRSVDDPVVGTGFQKLNGGFHQGRGMGIYEYRDRVPPRDASYEYHFVKPVRPQVECLLEARARVLQSLQNRLHSRLVPIQGGGCGFVRKSGGTGVFLPRVFNTHTDFRKKQGMRNRGEIQQMPSMKRSGVVKLEESHCQLPPVAPDMGLPQDWIY